MHLHLMMQVYLLFLLCGQRGGIALFNQHPRPKLAAQHKTHNWLLLMDAIV